MLPANIAHLLSSMAAKDPAGGAANRAKVYKFRVYQWQLEEQPMAADEAGARLPMPRSGHKMVCSGSRLYSFGGYNPDVLISDSEMADDPFWSESWPLFKELWRFCTLSRWVPVVHVSVRYMY